LDVSPAGQTCDIDEGAKSHDLYVDQKVIPTPGTDGVCERALRSGPALKRYVLRVDQKLIRLPAWRSKSRNRSRDSEATSDDFRADQKVIPSLAAFTKCVKLLSIVDQKLIPI
jgi:hypothetical protein